MNVKNLILCAIELDHIVQPHVKYRMDVANSLAMSQLRLCCGGVSSGMDVYSHGVRGEPCLVAMTFSVETLVGITGLRRSFVKAL